MTITSQTAHVRVSHFVLAGMLALTPIGFAAAQSGTPPQPKPAPVIVTPPPSVRFQQTVQQQQVNDQLQKAQLEQQLHQGVSDNTKRPYAANSQSQQQLDQADRAQQDIDRARQQDTLNRYQQAESLPRVVPQSQPAPSHSGG